jgi:hypothetical protein
MQRIGGVDGLKQRLEHAARAYQFAFVVASADVSVNIEVRAWLRVGLNAPVGSAAPSDSGSSSRCSWW